MNLDDHPYLSTYLLGCVFAFSLGVAVVVEGYLIDWLFKGNVFRKNLNKIRDPAEQGLKHDVGLFAFGLTTGTVFSWLGVLQYLWRLLWTPLTAIREAFSSVPEDIKALRFPLQNNPGMSREAVWAYAYALGAKAGTVPTASQMAWELEQVQGFYPSFQNDVALRTLDSLNVVDKAIISKLLSESN